MEVCLQSVLTKSSAGFYVSIIGVNNMNNKSKKDVKRVKGYNPLEVIMVIVVFSILARWVSTLTLDFSQILAH